MFSKDKHKSKSPAFKEQNNNFGGKTIYLIGKLVILIKQIILWKEKLSTR